MATSTLNVNPQDRALEFKVGDFVSPVGAPSTAVGRVLEVWPAIGMVDVEWSTGSARVAVEDLVRVEEGVPVPPQTNSTPGGPPVRPGRKAADPTRVAEAFVKQAIYWAARDRKYRATSGEQEGKTYHCPKCKEVPLRKARYKRIEGKSVPLLACPQCLFMIRTHDIMGCHLSGDCDEGGL